jgi:predicted transposase YdaD
LTLRPDLIELIVPILSERFQDLSPSQIVATLGISKDVWRDTRALRDILEEGRQERREEGRELGLEEGKSGRDQSRQNGIGRACKAISHSSIIGGD